MQLFGARVVVLADRAAHVGWLVRERGWYPSSGMTPEPVWHALRRRGLQDDRLRDLLPARRPLPGAGARADVRRRRDLRSLEGIPRAAGARRAGRAATDGRGAGGRLRPDRARMARGRRGGAGASGSANDRGVDRGRDRRARRRSGRSPSPEAPRRRCRMRRSCDAMRRLAGQGIAVEPSSAAPVAAALALAARSELETDEDVVCVLTGAGAKWPDALVDALTPRELRTRARRPCARGSTRSTRSRRPGDRAAPTLTPGSAPSESSRVVVIDPGRHDRTESQGCAWPRVDEGDIR